MTPAILAAEKAAVSFRVHEYVHDDGAAYGLEAAEKLGVSPARVFKTLVVLLSDSRHGIAVVPVDAQLNLKRAAKALGSKRAEMATPADAERVTGYVLGGVSPLGGRKRLPTVIDASAREETSMFVSAGRRGLEIEIAPGDLARLAGASFADLCRA